MSGLITVAFLVTGCASKEEKARDALSKLLLHFTPESFVQAAANNDQKALQLFLDAKMTPDTKTKDDKTALMIAAERGNLEVIDLLLKAKANVDVINGRGETALSHSIEAAQLQAAQRLLENGANADLMVGNNTLLTLAVRTGNANIVKLLLDEGANPNKQQSSGSALSEAVQRGWSDVIKLLLEAKADPNVKTQDGTSVLVYTLANEQPEIAKYLVNHGANPKETLSKGATLLTYAKLLGYDDLAELLIQKGVKEASLLTFNTVEQTDGIYPSEYPLIDNNLILEANEGYKHPSITYNLAGKASRFSAVFANNHSGNTFFEYPFNVQLIVEGDGKKLYEGNSIGLGAQPETIDLDITDVVKLTIKMEANKYYHYTKGILKDPVILFP